MKNLIIAVVIIALAITACNPSSKQSTEITSKADSVAYQLGFIFGDNISIDFPNLNTDIVTKNITETFEGKVDPVFSSQREASMYIQQYMMKKRDSLFVASQGQLDSIAASIGYFYGQNLKNDFTEINVAIVNKTFIEAYDGKAEKMFNTDQDANTFISNYLKEKQKIEGEKNKKEGEEFLAENAKKPGITVTESGLQYEVLKEGNGPKPQSASDKVRVTYHGTLIDGTVFESSVESKDTVSFALNQVISGWTEGVQLMSVGSKYRFYLPSELAYGANPRPGGMIKSNMALIFEIELFGINE